MKKTHIIALLVIAVSIGVILTSLSGASTYANFTQAFEQPGKKFTVVGHLDHEYEITSEPMRCSFYIRDKENNLKKVVYNKAKPQDFERSESVVLTGSADGDTFFASEISMKCPSKYNDVNKTQ
ncbi:MAG TPA: cytochrome c maturation protein CcmE [Flavobacteriales bacterium]|nr:cytochrome C biogenesis protein [Flavobacteriales bacterium]HRE74482.1 cytochrome c maturation protein CcmE [Flavobacteriales bacterium]HRE96352.1 cytochrome c maturation protein CcmE [Flavobacteriales bacterium]HRJ35784.1 cytochrome c maturation protein CcmE [Flavobacteriales bacterium]HRJ37819.1 cytochrome c maturation protein CcmE [Flavobacteriales bacterium]